MDLSNDPEIICVFCGLGFTSVENVELHILQHHQSNSIDQIENRKTCIIDDYADQTLSEGSFFMSNEKKEINLIELQKQIKSSDAMDDPLQEHAEIIQSKILNKVNSHHHRKKHKVVEMTYKESIDLKETGFHLTKDNDTDQGANKLLNISETIVNLVDEKVDKIMKRSLRCQSCDKQFTLSNNLSRHRRLYCSSLKDSNLQNNSCPHSIIDSNKPTSSSTLMNKPGDISKMMYEIDAFMIKRETPKTKIGKPLQKQKCPKCFKRFLFKITQFIHLHNHKINDNRKWKCKHCGFRYSRKQILLRHYQRNCVAMFPLNSCFDSNGEIYPELHTCRFCDMVFTDPIYVEMHQLKVCQRLSTSGACEKFDNSDKSSIESVGIHEKHRENDFQNSKEEASGDVCMTKESSSKSCSIDQSVSEIFESESSSRSPETQLNGTLKNDNLINNANQKFHWHNYSDDTQQKLFQCEVCKKSFSSRSSLSNHIKSHYSSRGQPFTCRDCNRRFVNLLSLQDHRREMCSQKSNESETKSVYSLSNFNGVSQVPIWPNITNSNSGTQPVTCLHCNGVFYDRLELEEHALSKHSNEQGNILCLLCDRSFTTNMALRVHLTKSHGFANGGCPGVSQNLPPMPKLETNYHIGDDFPIKKRRKEKRLYELDKEYACDNCHRNFSTGQALGNHKRACLNMPNEFISVESKPQTPSCKSNSKLHSIESLIFDNTNIRSSFTNDKNVFLAFN